MHAILAPHSLGCNAFTSLANGVLMKKKKKEEEKEKKKYNQYKLKKAMAIANGLNIRCNILRAIKCNKEKCFNNRQIFSLCNHGNMIHILKCKKQFREAGKDLGHLLLCYNKEHTKTWNSCN